MSVGVPICRIRPSIQHGDAIRHRQRFDLVVGDKQRRAVLRLLQVLEFDAQRFAQLGIQVRQRLVHQEDARLADNRPPDRNALHLTAGEPRRLAFQQMRDAQLFGGARDPLLDLVFRQVAQRRRAAETPDCRKRSYSGRANTAGTQRPCPGRRA